MTEKKAPERLVTAKAAIMLGLSPSTLAKWRTRKEGPPFHKRGRRLVHYYEHEIAAWLAACDLAARSVPTLDGADEPV